MKKSAPKSKAVKKSAPAKPVVKDQKEAAAVPVHSNDQKEAAANPTKKRPNIVSAEGFAWYGMSGWWKDEYATLKPATLASLLEAKKAPSSRLIDSLRRAANPLTAPVPARPVSQQPVKSAPVAVSKPSPTRTPPKPVRTAPAAAPATEPPGYGCPAGCVEAEPGQACPVCGAVRPLPVVPLAEVRRETADALSRAGLSRLSDRAAGKPVAPLLTPITPQSNYGYGRVTAPHLIIEALAGTGKTTTLVEGLKVVRGLPTKFQPSPQQAVIWDAMARSRGARSICFAAFNVSIKDELTKRMPEGCQAKTLHGLGFAAVAKAVGRNTNLIVNQNGERVCDYIAEIVDKPFQALRKDRPEFVSAVRRLVSLCKMTLTGAHQDSETETPEQFEEALHGLCDHFEIEVDGNDWEEIVKLVGSVLEKCASLSSSIDFDDMPWLPIVLNLPIWRNDLLLVDEFQDLNRCQQALAMKAGSRIIGCGDVNQAIYGFAGADSESMPRMFGLLSRTPAGCERLPLTVTRRCGRAIVEQAKAIVPTFEAHESNCEGKVSRRALEGVPFATATENDNGTRSGVEVERTGYRYMAQDGDFVICRTTAPLVSQCLRFLKEGRKAVVQGRDIGQGLLKLIDKFEVDTVPELITATHGWYDLEVKKLEAEKHPSEAKRIALDDRRDLILTFCEDIKTVAQVRERIERIFSDSTTTGIRLSTVHRAKGLESKRVFIIQPPGASMPHPSAKSPWQLKQEYNLKYVAITRAIEELVWVS